MAIGYSWRSHFQQKRSLFDFLKPEQVDMGIEIERKYLVKKAKWQAYKEDISAFYDQDEGQYHVFFPLSEQLTKRLTLTLNPIQGGESKWSTGDFLNARCGTQLGGVTLMGTPGGVWERRKIEDELDFSPEMVVITPILWQGAINDIKESYSFILQATGKGELQVEAFDERGRYLSAIQFTITEGGVDDNFPDVPLSRQYERKFEHR